MYLQTSTLVQHLLELRNCELCGDFLAILSDDSAVLQQTMMIIFSQAFGRLLRLCLFSIDMTGWRLEVCEAGVVVNFVWYCPIFILSDD